MDQLTRREFLLAAVGVGILTASACTPTKESARTSTGHIRSAAAITQVLGAGQTLVAVAVHYDTDINTATLTGADFAVEGRTVTRVYANDEPATATTGRTGPYVIIELETADDAGLLWGGPSPSTSSQTNEVTTSASTTSGASSSTTNASPGLGSTSHPVVKTAEATVTQVRPVATGSGTRYPATESVKTSDSIDPLVDSFRQFTFADPATGKQLPYNLFTPTDIDPTKKYPLVLFMHDASVVGADVQGPLVQGLGAVCWAQSADQQRNPCFVVAPQYPTVVVSDDYEPTTLFDTTVNLLHDLVRRYPIDAASLHATGQSMGAMMVLAMNIKHPDLLSSSYVVAGQWPSTAAAALAHKRLWVTVSQGDTKAYPMENAIMSVIEGTGSKVTRATWDARWTEQRLSTAATDVAAQGADINYTSFLPRTVPGSTASSGQEHMGTWQVAYSIPAIRDWIFEQ